MNEQLIISIDIGTTSTKATLYSASGKVIQSFYQGYSMTTSENGSATQDPETLFQATLTTLKQAFDFTSTTREQTVAVSFSSAMHSLIGLDKDSKPVTPIITWADSRATKQADELKHSENGTRFYQKSGTPIHPMTPLTKILRLQQDEPTLFKKIKLFSSVKEYILFRLFNEHVIDYSVASGTGLFNIHTLEWDKEILDFLSLTEDYLPTAYPPTHQLTRMNATYKEYFGLQKEIPFVIGASDGALANLGTNCITPDKMNVTIGTSAALRLTVREPLLHPQGKTFCYVLDDGYWVVGGAANNGGMIIDWARKSLDDSPLSHEKFMEKVASIRPGANNLFFHPYLSGERAPVWLGNIRGSFTGLSLNHTQAHLCRAVLEGVCYNIADIVQSIEDLAIPFKQVIASGGFSHSPVWKQMMSDVLNETIYFPESHESSSLGAMILALKSLGIIHSLDESNNLPIFTQSKEVDVIQPDKSVTDKYHSQFKIYQALKELVVQQAFILDSNTPPM